MDLIKVAEEAFATGKKFPEFRSGDTITVAYKIIEGSKERIQLYRGVVIKISGHGDKKRFTVRKMSGTVGVERIFPIESPNIDSIEVNKHGKVRRAKLYYLRNLTGKKARIAERRVVNKVKDIKRDSALCRVPFCVYTPEVNYLFFFDVMPPFFVNVMVDCCSLRDVWSKIRLGLNRRPLK